MDSTPFSKRCEIIKDFAELYAQQEWFVEFSSWYNLGVPWAIGVHYGDITANDGGIQYINDTWNALLKFLSVTDEGFDTIGQVMENVDATW